MRYEVRDGRWRLRDKLTQYRGILKLHARDKKLGREDAVKRANRAVRQLHSLRVDIAKYRDALKGTIEGSSDITRRLLVQRFKQLRFKCLRRKTTDTFVAITDENHLRRRELDKLRYEKKRTMKRCFDLQLEKAVLTRKYVAQTEKVAGDYLQQRLVTRYQQSMAKQNAAKAIRSTYILMIDVLRKDAMYHDTLLSGLKKDRVGQSKIILRTTVMGQLAAECLDDIRGKYVQMTRDVWKNMKARERTLSEVRGRVDDLWMYAQSLIRTESDTVMFTKHSAAPSRDIDVLEVQINSLKMVFAKVEELWLVRSYRELYSRLEEQEKQRTRLLVQFERNMKERDALLVEKNHALTTLSDIAHSFVGTEEQFQADRTVLLEQIQIQINRELEHRNERKDRGTLLMDMRAALQNMVGMLLCVRRGGRTAKRVPKESGKKSVKEPIEKDDTEELEELPQTIETPLVEQIETEALTLLSKVSRKVGTLFGMSNFELDREKEYKARDLYRTYVSDYNSKLKFTNGEFEPAGLFVEHEAVDSSIPTRAEIKLRSKQTVEAHLKYD